jgi:MYXO-CTERM domain-containing protein
VETQPTHGTLTGTAPDLTYRPAVDYNGPDSFTFTVKDGGKDSAPATVTLTVRPVNDAPVAHAQEVTTAEDSDVPVTLTGSDVDSASLAYTVLAGPEHGTLTGTPPALTYTPTADSNGADSFTFKVNDGALDSAPVTVTLTVTAVNDAPVATSQELTVGQEPTALKLSATDVDGDALTYEVTQGPEAGTLSGTPPDVTFTPPPGFRGEVSFTFTASDGQLTSAPATVRLTGTGTGTDDEPSGCGCGSASPTQALAALALLGLALRRRRTAP